MTDYQCYSNPLGVSGVCTLYRGWSATSCENTFVGKPATSCVRTHIGVAGYQLRGTPIVDDRLAAV